MPVNDTKVYSASQQPERQLTTRSRTSPECEADTKSGLAASADNRRSERLGLAATNRTGHAHSDAKTANISGKRDTEAAHVWNTSGLRDADRPGSCPSANAGEPISNSIPSHH